ncbi:hypothetical protein BU15DRAFT_67561 [Melanogaster broomeanus]|nr:hypothetical protein BU15DRAFT_67561 [Melanogaster broomeanus]
MCDSLPPTSSDFPNSTFFDPPPPNSSSVTGEADGDMIFAIFFGTMLFLILLAIGLNVCFPRPEEEDVEARAGANQRPESVQPPESVQLVEMVKCPERDQHQHPGTSSGESVPPPPGYTPMAMAKALLYYSKEDLTAGCGNRAEGDEEEEPGAALAAPLLNGRM